MVFVGTFSAGPQDIRIENGALRIVQDGELRKFVREVEHRTFAGRLAAEAGKPVLYVTERCVFRLTTEGLELIEVAPGWISSGTFLPAWTSAPSSTNPG